MSMYYYIVVYSQQSTHSITVQLPCIIIVVSGDYTNSKLYYMIPANGKNCIQFFSQWDVH